MNIIVMPKIGLTMTEGTLASWNVSPGEEVRMGDVIFVVETDKVATEITARAAGKIDALKVAAGETVPVGAVVATWTGPSQGAEEDSTSADGTNGNGDVAVPHPSSPSLVKPRSRIVSTPYARRLARSLGLDLHGITGSGPAGRVKAGDLRQQNSESTSERSAAEAAPAVSIKPTRRPLSNIERTVARRLTAAKQDIPHFYVMAEADVTRLIEFRKKLNSGIGKIKISFTHLLLLATGRALLENSALNIVWDNEEIVTLQGSDVGLAVDTSKGLFAPVLRRVGTKRLDELAQDASDVVELARAGALRPEHLSGGAVTISNVGMHGASWIVPIINPGQSSIIGVGTAKAHFCPDASGSPVLKQFVSLVLSGDHRVLDGVKGAQFLSAIVHLLEHPSELAR
jgi:pyruvate dehydrogenase E2 component (dihydrolipoamide acetyltransferase)